MRTLIGPRAAPPSAIESYVILRKDGCTWVGDIATKAMFDRPFRDSLYALMDINGTNVAWVYEWSPTGWLLLAAQSTCAHARGYMSPAAFPMLTTNRLLVCLDGHYVAAEKRAS